MKRILLLVLALTLVIGTMTGCGKTSDNTPSGGTSTPSDTSSTTSTPGGTDSTSKPAESGLVSKVGDTASYGTYNGQPIEWQTLAVETSDKEHQRALLISKEIVSYWVFNGENKDITWENSTIRQWLNSDFYTAAFTDEQKAKILESYIDNPANSGIGGGANTKERVFLLSLEEVTKYFTGDGARSVKYNASQAQMEALAKAISEAGNKDNWSSKQSYDEVLADLNSFNGTTDRWWLRTSGGDLGRAANISYDGSLDTTGAKVYQLEGFRPAIWVDITPEDESGGTSN
ncbi:MAG: DUF6273 domain-containing protein [Clostridiales bacterium]|jgi:hypothetical protein|nr:DUF6273 domain-containing protein [Clostridiales bacterium]